LKANFKSSSLEVRLLEGFWQHEGSRMEKNYYSWSYSCIVSKFSLGLIQVGGWVVKRAVGTMYFNADIPSWIKLFRLCTVVLISCGCSRCECSFLPSFLLLPSFSLFIFETVSLCSSGWPWTYHTPAFTSWLLGLQVCVTMPGLMWISVTLNVLHIIC
jgi:hypothetical protein